MDLFKGYESLIFKGLLLTAQLAAVSLVFGIILGLLMAGAKLSRFRVLRVPVDVITNVLRSVPELLIIFLIYYGGSQIINALIGLNILISQFWAGVTALSLVFASYASETFRAAFLAVPVGQLEAARAFGMSPWKVFFRIHLPQLWRFALPGLGNLWLVLTKDTSLVSTIGLADVVRQTGVAVGNTKEPFTFYLLLACIYLTITVVSTAILNRLERRAQRGVRMA